MPVKVERKLAATARKRGYKGPRFRRYVYGTLAKIKARRKARRRAMLPGRK